MRKVRVGEDTDWQIIAGEDNFNFVFIPFTGKNTEKINALLSDIQRFRRRTNADGSGYSVDAEGVCAFGAPPQDDERAPFISSYEVPEAPVKEEPISRRGMKFLSIDVPCDALQFTSTAGVDAGVNMMSNLILIDGAPLISAGIYLDTDTLVFGESLRINDLSVAAEDALVFGSSESAAVRSVISQTSALQFTSSNMFGEVWVVSNDSLVFRSPATVEASAVRINASDSLVFRSLSRNWQGWALGYIAISPSFHRIEKLVFRSLRWGKDWWELYNYWRLGGVWPSVRVYLDPIAYYPTKLVFRTPANLLKFRITPRFNVHDPGELAFRDSALVHRSADPGTINPPISRLNLRDHRTVYPDPYYNLISDPTGLAENNYIYGGKTRVGSWPDWYYLDVWWQPSTVPKYEGADFYNCVYGGYYTKIEDGIELLPGYSSYIGMNYLQIVGHTTGDDPPGMIYQNMATEPGATYKMTFTIEKTIGRSFNGGDGNQWNKYLEIAFLNDIGMVCNRWGPFHNRTGVAAAYGCRILDFYFAEGGNAYRFSDDGYNVHFQATEYIDPIPRIRWWVEGSWVTFRAESNVTAVLLNGAMYLGITNIEVRKV